MRQLIFFIIMSCFFIFSNAEVVNNQNQVLVFLKSGDVKLFFDNELECIEASIYDSDSVRHEYPVSQVFHDVKGESTIIPIAEIDSVAFGNHNEIIVKSDVHMITDKDLEFIIDFDKESNTIYYKDNTPAEILPYVGEKLFYGDFTTMFPWGLSARVLNVTAANSLIIVTLEDLELNDIFDKLFYAGSSNLFDEKYINTNKTQRRIRIPLGKGCSLSVEAGGEAYASNIVINPLLQHYHVDFEGEISYEMEFEMESEESSEWYEEIVVGGIKAPVLRATEAIGVLKMDFNVVAFLEALAQLKLDFTMSRKYPFKFSWDRKGGKINCNDIKTDDEAEQKYVDEARIEFLLDGKLYTGLGLVFRLSTLANRLGTNIRLRLGTEMEGNIGFGVLRELEDEYNEETYGKGELNCCGKLEFDVTAFSHIFGDQNSTLFDYELRFGQKKLNLFPDYKQTRAVAARINSGMSDSSITTENEISVAAVTSTELVAPIETGFALSNENDEILEDVFFDKPLEANDTTLRPISHTFNTFKKPEELKLQPVFKYHDFTIKAKPIAIKKDMMIQPVIFNINNGSVNILSGMSVTGSADEQNTFILVGNYFPLEQPNPLFSENVTAPPLVDGPYINADETNLILGTWHGTLSDKSSISITFRDDDSGYYSHDNLTEDFTFKINSPQSGDILLIMKNQAKVAKLCAISDMWLKIYSPDLNETIILSK